MMMTREEILQLEAGTALDKLIAEKVMQAPREFYSTDLNDAWEVVDHLHKMGCSLCLEDWRTSHGMWCALFTMADGHDTGQILGETVPLVICRASLLVNL